jgi:hypothetical protein
MDNISETESENHFAVDNPAFVNNNVSMQERHTLS